VTRKPISLAALAGTIAAAALGISTPMQAQAHMVQAPCDFITSGGFIYKDNGAMANFGANGGCKNDQFWGDVNYVDHEHNFHLKSTVITGYLFDPATPNSRDICGKGRVNDSAYEVMFRIRLVDNGEPGSSDTFGITIDNWHAPERFYMVSSRQLANGQGGGGNVQLHKSNKSTTASAGMLGLRESDMCGDIDHP
jgi:hypothetical protein